VEADEADFETVFFVQVATLSHRLSGEVEADPQFLALKPH
jgi:hypothetical protein